MKARAWGNQEAVMKGNAIESLESRSWRKCKGLFGEKSMQGMEAGLPG